MTESTPHTARISLPDTAARGELVSVRTLVSHPMESGFRLNARGERIPQDIITSFTCRYLGQPVFEAEFGPGMAANPFLTFHFVARETGDVILAWTDQHGESWQETRRIIVEG